MFAERYCYLPDKNSKDPGKRRSLLWPVKAWRVLYPASNQRPGANLFQEALLGLIRTGMRDADSLATALTLDAELVRFIIATQLQPNGWLDARFKLTSSGERLLDDAEDNRLELSVGYAFQDALSGQWMPRFVSRLDEIVPVEHDERSRPVFVLDRAKGKKIAPFMLHEKHHSKPDFQRLPEAYKRYRMDLSAASGRADDFSLNGTRIEALDDTPIPLYLWCELYRDEDELERWLISDPFRVRKAVPWLREPFCKIAARTQPGVPGLLQGLLPELSSDGLTQAQWLTQLEEKTDYELDADYPYLKREALIREHLARILRQRDRLEGRSRPHAEEINALMSESASLLEAVLQWLLRNWSISPPWEKHGYWSRREAEAAFNSLGLPCLTPSLVKTLAGQERKRLHDAMLNWNQPLKALLAAALFAAAERKDHPFHEAKTLELERLIELTDSRNKGSHASGKEAEAAPALDFSAFAIRWMAQFKDLY